MTYFNLAFMTYFDWYVINHAKYLRNTKNSAGGQSDKCQVFSFTTHFFCVLYQKERPVPCSSLQVPTQKKNIQVSKIHDAARFVREFDNG